MPLLDTSPLAGADLARALMDVGFRLMPRENPNRELVRLGRPGKHNPSEVVIIYRSGEVVTCGRGREKAAKAVKRLQSGGAR